jgi:hypothetical protein
MTFPSSCNVRTALLCVIVCLVSCMGSAVHAAATNPLVIDFYPMATADGAYGFPSFVNKGDCGATCDSIFFYPAKVNGTWLMILDPIANVTSSAFRTNLAEFDGIKAVFHYHFNASEPGSLYQRVRARYVFGFNQCTANKQYQVYLSNSTDNSVVPALDSEDFDTSFLNTDPTLNFGSKYGMGGLFACDLFLEAEYASGTSSVFETTYDEGITIDVEFNHPLGGAYDVTQLFVWDVIANASIKIDYESNKYPPAACTNCGDCLDQLCTDIKGFPPLWDVIDVVNATGGFEDYRFTFNVTYDADDCSVAAFDGSQGDAWLLGLAKVRRQCVVDVHIAYM